MRKGSNDNYKKVVDESKLLCLIISCTYVRGQANTVVLEEIREITPKKTHSLKDGRNLTKTKKGNIEGNVGRQEQTRDEEM